MFINKFEENGGMLLRKWISAFAVIFLLHNLNSRRRKSYDIVIQSQL